QFEIRSSSINNAEMKKELCTNKYKVAYCNGIMACMQLSNPTRNTNFIKS
ncbi:MAG: hypothetical protein ACI90V_004773, partial [Bacillariaceae sp.]